MSLSDGAAWERLYGRKEWFEKSRRLRNLGANFMQVGLYLLVEEYEFELGGWISVNALRKLYSHST